MKPKSKKTKVLIIIGVFCLALAALISYFVIISSQYYVLKAFGDAPSCLATGPECESFPVSLKSPLGTTKEYRVYGTVQDETGNAILLKNRMIGEKVKIKMDNGYITTLTVVN